MDASAQLSFLNCYICFQSLKKPKMCPSCSKVACEKCLRQWIQEKRPQCPHCRKVTPLSNFAQCQRLISDVKHLLQAMDKNEKVKQKCSQHKIQMSYYCQECQVPICSDCGMFGIKHRSHKITHLKRVYQQYKNKILNQLVRFDQKIDGFRKNGYQIKFQMQKLVAQIGQRKSFIQQYFLAILQRLQEQFKEKQQKITEKYQANAKQIQFFQSFRQSICRELQSSSQNQLITKSNQLIGYIQSVYDKSPDVQAIQHTFDTIHEIVPKYNQFKYTLKNYASLGEGIIFSQSYINNGIQWRLKIYPRGNGLAKDTHMSVFLQMTKGFISGNKYEYKIQLINHKNIKDSVIREYSSNFDIGECWGYNQFIPIQQLNNDFLNESGDLMFIINVRNPSYRSLVRDQKQYIQNLQMQVHLQQMNSSIVNQKKSQNKLGQKQKTEKLGQKQKVSQKQKQQKNKVPKFTNELKPQSKDKIRRILNKQLQEMRQIQQQYPRMSRVQSSRVHGEKKKQIKNRSNEDERSIQNQQDEDDDQEISNSFFEKIINQK